MTGVPPRVGTVGRVYRPPLVDPASDLVTVIETERFRIRPMTVRQDLLTDYEAVMSSPELLGAAFGDPDSVQPYSFEQEIIELGWHEKEFQMGYSFTFTVVSLDESSAFGNVYVLPADRGGYDAAVYTWVRGDQLDSGLGDELFEVTTKWIAESWPFERVAYPGREIPWDEWKAMEVA